MDGPSPSGLDNLRASRHVSSRVSRTIHNNSVGINRNTLYMSTDRGGDSNKLYDQSNNISRLQVKSTAAGSNLL